MIDEKVMLQAVLRSDFKSFVAKTFATLNPGQKYINNWHIDAISEHLESVRSGEIKRLIINMPPRALKSICTSVAFPAWLLGHDPRSRIIVASHTLPLSLKHSNDTREILRAQWFNEAFPWCRVARGMDEKHKFITTQRGFRMATSIGASLTGEGGNVLIIDDPLTPEHAMQKSIRDAANSWFEHTFASRLDDKENGSIVLVMQRLHMDDLSGHLLKKQGFTHLCLQAIAPEEKTYSLGSWKYRRAAGEVLCKSRETLELYDKLKTEIGSHVFSAQYQQQPVPEEGFIIKPHWIKYYEVEPAGQIVQSWDTAIKAGLTHDPSVCITAIFLEGKVYLREVMVAKMEYPDLKRTVINLAEKHSSDLILIEDKASGQQLLQDLRKTSGLPVVACSPKTDKMTRVQAISALIEAGILHLPKTAPWLAAFEAEIFQFPASAHDDQVDALTQLLQWVRAKRSSEFSIRSI